MGSSGMGSDAGWRLVAGNPLIIADFTLRAENPGLNSEMH
jgi:hypothetical protein